MQLNLSTYNDIIYGSLRPWKQSELNENRFSLLLSGLPKIYYVFQPRYELDFLKPLGLYRKYYAAFISNQAISYLNTLHQEIGKADTNDEKYYLINTSLTKTISQQLIAVSQIIESRNYKIEQFNFIGKLNREDVKRSDESYIFHYLKAQLICLYKEIRDNYTSLLSSIVLKEDDEIYFRFFNESTPSQTYISLAKDYPDTNEIVFYTIDEEIFKPLKSDFRKRKKGVYSFDQLVQNSDKFVELENLLFEKKMIDKNYDLIENHGNKVLMAAFYHQLCNKGYFRKIIFPENLTNDDLKIRKFLNHRYNCKLDKQFRNLKDTYILDEILEKHFWLNNIKSCK